MATSLRQFRVELYEEHLEDASFLYTERHALFLSQEIPWVGLLDFEERLEAHIDALVVGAERALDVCGRRAVEGDAGELFAAVCVFCRQLQAPRLAEVLKTLDHEDPDKRRAVGDALKYELPDAWRDFCSGAVAQPDGKLAPILAEVLGYRRFKASEILVRRLQNATPPALPSLLWSLGRIRADFAIPVVRQFLSAEDLGTARAAVHAALRLQDEDTVHKLMASSGAPESYPIALGLAGGRRMAKPLLRALKESEKPLDVITALGLLGDLSVVRPLVDLLSDEQLRSAAALALHVITGAMLSEEVLIPEQITEDEMFPEELKAFRERGQQPLRGDGQPFGTKVRRLAQDPAVWQQWLEANAAGFQAGQRYRYGVLCSPQVLLDCLRAEAFPKTYRGWVGEELLVRYAIDLPFEADMLVPQQQRVLREATALIAQATTGFEPGQWHFAGQPV